jgi:UDP-N-acetylmuramoyl-tripeptide--D-alanyl-D-alanine ligase
MLSLKDVVDGLREQLLAPCLPVSASKLFKNVAIDSRQVEPGDLFVALHGEKRDGHDFIDHAIERGATGVIAERMAASAPGYPTEVVAFILVPDSLAALQTLAGYWRRQHQVEVIGITGSVGKTTTKEAVATVLLKKYTVLKSKGNLNNEIGLPLTLLQLYRSHQKAVLEMAMYALGEIRALCDIAQPVIGVVTNVGPTHLECLGTLERIAQAKAELVESLPSEGMAILNGDDPRVKAMRELTQAQVLLYGLDPTFDVWASDVEVKGLEGVRFRIHRGASSASVDTPLLGHHSVYTALAAASAAFAQGFDLEEVVQGLRHLDTSPRLAVRRGMKGCTIIDDTYNASPASALAALDLLAELSGRRIAVLGDMLELGSFEEEGHRQVGRRAAEVLDKLVVVGQRGSIIGKEATRYGLKVVQFAKSNEEAAERLMAILSPEDYVLVKGSRSMAMEQIVEMIEEV